LPRPRSAAVWCLPAAATMAGDRARRGARGALFPKTSSCGAEFPARGPPVVGSAPSTWRRGPGPTRRGTVNRVRSGRKQP